MKISHERISGFFFAFCQEFSDWNFKNRYQTYTNQYGGHGSPVYQNRAWNLVGRRAGMGELKNRNVLKSVFYYLKRVPHIPAEGRDFFVLFGNPLIFYFPSILTQFSFGPPKTQVSCFVNCFKNTTGFLKQHKTVSFASALGNRDSPGTSTKTLGLKPLLPIDILGFHFL